MAVAAVVEETVEVTVGVAAAGMTTGIVEAVAMMIVTEATEAGAETAATPGREGGAPEMTGVALVLESGGRRGAGARQGAGTGPGVAAKASPGAGAKQGDICGIAHQRHENQQYFDVESRLF